MIHNGISPFALVHGTLRPLEIVPPVLYIP